MIKRLSPKFIVIKNWLLEVCIALGGVILIMILIFIHFLEDNKRFLAILTTPDSNII